MVTKHASVIHPYIQKYWKVQNIGNFEYWKFWIFCHEESIKAWGNRHFYPDLDNVHTFPNITWYPMNISNFSFIYQWLFKNKIKVRKKCLVAEKVLTCGHSCREAEESLDEWSAEWMWIIDMYMGMTRTQCLGTTEMTKLFLGEFQRAGIPSYRFWVWMLVVCEENVHSSFLPQDIMSCPPIVTAPSQVS